MRNGLDNFIFILFTWPQHRARSRKFPPAPDLHTRDLHTERQTDMVLQINAGFHTYYLSLPPKSSNTETHTVNYNFWRNPCNPRVISVSVLAVPRKNKGQARERVTLRDASRRQNRPPRGSSQSDNCSTPYRFHPILV